MSLFQLFFIVSVVSVIAGFAFLLVYPEVWIGHFRRIMGIHQWLYNDPFDRHCSVCSRRQIERNGDLSRTTIKEGNGNRLACKPVRK